MSLRSAIITAATALASSAIAVSTPTAAVAAPGNTVVIGDSLAANPVAQDYLAQRGIPIPGAGRMNGAGCATDYRFSGTYSDAAKVAVDDFTCSGASYRTGGVHLNELAGRATNAGALNGATKEVVLLGGANDTYPYVLNPSPLPVPVIEDQLRVAIQDTIRQVRQAAPNARIKVLGYPQISNGAGNVCLLNVIPGQPTQDLTVHMGEIEAALQRAGQTSAANERAAFVDLKPVSQGHEMCSNDRWMAGVIDTTAGPHNLPLHMTNAGLEAVARVAAR
ncbi:GDSL-type esterase/lipase family protein [Corynebacterium heidelbergense]|uniref:SGNH hydrolase-type esterase domain-containing protein n=1 Tax=Corynebacterium heidelbergense TaxID=2055947 RepID=A0A364VBA1_9CORY|nr:GDSL-type esterase/lipase family protein [Corynebacterium heidelbergense]RAV33894.1 hypothetical protein CWC39_06040 [Corynebacterium heidelbergense]WCZ35941.1 hypothetical protein CHEID_01820 [Corynebacterium heidelbergense]